MAEPDSRKNFAKTSDLKEFRVKKNVFLFRCQNQIFFFDDQEVLSEVSELVPNCLLKEEEQNSKSALLKEASTSLNECAPDAATKLNEVGQQLSIYYGSVVTSPTDDTDEKQNAQTTSSSASAIPKSESKDKLRSTPKRHIMISYNRSSRPICERIYNGLVVKSVDSFVFDSLRKHSPRIEIIKFGWI